MSSEPLFKVRKIEEVPGNEEANEYLALGWKLLKVLAVKTEPSKRGELQDTAVYCLGWCYKNQDPKYPEGAKPKSERSKPPAGGKTGP